MITLVNNEIEILNEDNIPDGALLSDFFNFLCNLENYGLNSNRNPKYKKGYILDSQVKNLENKTKISTDYDYKIIKNIESKIQKGVIQNIRLSFDSGDYGTDVNVIDINNNEASIIGEFTEDAIVGYRSYMMFSLLKKDNQYKLICQYTRWGNNSLRYVLSYFISEFKNENLNNLHKFKVKTIIPKNVLEEYFRDGIYKELYVYRRDPKVHSDEKNNQGFNANKIVKHKEFGLVVKRPILSKLQRLKISNLLYQNKPNEILEVFGIELEDMENIKITLEHDGREKTYNLNKIHNESLNKDITKLVVPDYESNNKIDLELLISEFYTELNDIIEMYL